MVDLPSDIRGAVEDQLAKGEKPRAGYLKQMRKGETAHVVKGKGLIGAEVKRGSGEQTIYLSHYLLSDSRIFGVRYMDEKAEMPGWVAVGLLALPLGL